jgi:hypothetical protein
MDGCKKCAIVFQSVVASCEFINCKSVQMQVWRGEGEGELSSTNQKRYNRGRQT